MSLAIEWGDEDSDQSAFIYFDAVTSYRSSYKGKVTEHPIDSGANIADHFVKTNPRFTISGVITGADISVGNEDLTNEDGDSPINTKAAPDAVSVDSPGSSLNAFLPESITQFFAPQEPSIPLDGNESVDSVEDVKNAMTNLMAGEKYNEISKTFTNSMQLLKLHEYEGTTIRATHTDLVMVGLDFSEDPDSGDALYCDVILEQIRFAEGRVAELPADVVDSLKAKAAALADKGKQDSSISEIDLDEDDGTALHKAVVAFQNRGQ